jgi:hypothetical protein
LTWLPLSSRGCPGRVQDFDNLPLVRYTIAQRPSGRALIFQHALEKNMRGIKFVVLVVLSALGLALLGCSSPTPSPSPTPVPTHTPSPPPPTSTPTPVPTSTPTPVPTSTPALQALELTILHTNDTLGYTEPCG